ncbi:MAG: argininosuccinate lyase [Bacteroidota bacterium]|nr:argininosuccinate lyase [Bacteroidota bacterium]
MKLWQKGATPDPAIIEFTTGKDRTTDLCLAEWDITGSIAHAIMLAEIGLISHDERNGLLKALQSIFQKVKAGGFRIEDGIEDVHSQVEKELTEMLGPAGKKIHTGRSRNDQVLIDLRLFVRSEIDDLAINIGSLFEKLQSLSEKYKEILIPGYTHMQPAMVSSFGLWFGSYAESFADDLLLLSAARSINNRNPLGTQAGYGSTLPLNRMRTTELLEFDGLLYNSAYAGLSRGKTEMAAASALASVAQTLSRFAMDVCLFMTAEFRFIDFPDEYVTGSSIMPQKRNPDVFELIRGKANLILSIPGQMASLTSGLPSGYNRDFQLLKQLVIDGFSELNDCLIITIKMLESIKVSSDLIDKPLYNNIFSTEAVNRLVKQGVPFRDAYKQIAEIVAKGDFPKTTIQEYTHEGSIGNLCNREIKMLFDERMKVFKSKSAEELVAKMMKI